MNEPSTYFMAPGIAGRPSACLCARMFHSAPVHSVSLADRYSRSVSVSLAQRYQQQGEGTRSFIAAIVPPKQGIPRWYFLMLEDRYLRHWTVIARALLDMFCSAVNEPSPQVENVEMILWSFGAECRVFRALFGAKHGLMGGDEFGGGPHDHARKTHHDHSHPPKPPKHLVMKRQTDSHLYG